MTAPLPHVTVWQCPGIPIPQRRPTPSHFRWNAAGRTGRAETIAQAILAGLGALDGAASQRVELRYFPYRQPRPDLLFLAAGYTAADVDRAGRTLASRRQHRGP